MPWLNPLQRQRHLIDPKKQMLRQVLFNEIRECLGLYRYVVIIIIITVQATLGKFQQDIEKQSEDTKVQKRMEKEKMLESRLQEEEARSLEVWMMMTMVLTYPGG